MALSPNEIKDRALAFSREWKGEHAERAESQSFWNDFFQVFGVSRRRVASFDQRVRLARNRFEASGAKGGFIDLFWPGTLIAEHKSRGENLDTAYEQALSYFEGLVERDLPKYVIVSDFARLRLYDLDARTRHEFLLKDFYKNIRLFGFISGYAPQTVEEQDPVNVRAAERMGDLHDRLAASGYAGHALEVLLVRLLFCLFAEDTTIFEPRGAFREYLEGVTKEDGSDLGMHLEALFEVLNTPENKRQKNLDERLGAFPYVNGRLFEERLPVASFNSRMREALLDCCALDWGRISPAIFGALFQSVLDPKLRRNIGAHYTSEANILKVIRPLFLDELRAEFETARRSSKKLFELLKKLERLRFLDPACGCGNFLVIAYRELRQLELEILRLVRDSGQKHLDIFQLVKVEVDQFYGIEIEEFPAQIAQVALWLMDHQMNMRISEEFGHYFRRLPLTHAATIHHGNALRLDWNKVVSAESVDYVMGNPPFVGKQYQTAEQKADLDVVFDGVKGAGVLDYVSAWYAKAIRYLKGDESIHRLLAPMGGVAPRDRVKIAFVSTNSISQGEQVGILWKLLLREGVKIHFAHRTFQWSNEARGVAAVHCVIVGFALFDSERKAIFDYPDIQGEPHAVSATNINPYLVDAPDVVLESRRSPICPVPEIVFGSMANDGGHLILSDEERRALLLAEPDARRWLRPFLGADELLYGYHRWCLWLVGISPAELRSMPEVARRVGRVKAHRLASKREATRALAAFPALFGEIRQPDAEYLGIPRVSSEGRQFLPMGYLSRNSIASDRLQILLDAKPFHFGVLSSSMHFAWMKHTCGRLESRFNYSNNIVYNNFPWPQTPTSKQADAIEDAARGVLDARKLFPSSTLADLYDPVAMPPELRRAHQTLDRAVDTAYGRKVFSSEADRVSFLFELYLRYTQLPLEEPKVQKAAGRGK